MSKKIKECTYIPHVLQFYRPAGTSRGILFTKKSYFIIADMENGSRHYAECGILPGLSIDDRPGYEGKLLSICNQLKDGIINEDLSEWPSIRFAVEMLQLEISNGHHGFILDNAFYQESDRIPINGLIWMGDEDFMSDQITKKVNSGFRCIKMKVGALDWETEKKLLLQLREQGGKDLTIRVDANGAWDWNDESKVKMEFLHNINVHSIEQPIAAGKTEAMQKMIDWADLPIALDEELFAHIHLSEKEHLLDQLPVDYIVLKPSLVGGIESCEEWIKACEKRHISFWITSALESNVGLNAISQFAYKYAKGQFQGLGTGSLYDNNIQSPLEIIGDNIRYNSDLSWDYSKLSLR